jgi:hypothetical protein
MVAQLQRTAQAEKTAIPLGRNNIRAGFSYEDGKRALKRYHFKALFQRRRRDLNCWQQIHCTFSGVKRRYLV